MAFTFKTTLPEWTLQAGTNVLNNNLNTAPVRDGRDPLGAPGVGADDAGVPPLGYVLLDPLEHGRLRVEVVDGNVEEALDLGGVQVHGDDLVGARRGEHVGHELGGDRRPGLVLLVLSVITVSIVYSEIANIRLLENIEAESSPLIRVTSPNTQKCYCNLPAQSLLVTVTPFQCKQ